MVTALTRASVRLTVLQDVLDQILFPDLAIARRIPITTQPASYVFQRAVYTYQDNWITFLH